MKFMKVMAAPNVAPSWIFMSFMVKIFYARPARLLISVSNMSTATWL